MPLHLFCIFFATIDSSTNYENRFKILGNPLNNRLYRFDQARFVLMIDVNNGKFYFELIKLIKFSPNWMIVLV